MFTSPDDYAYHIGQVASLGSKGLMVVRRNLSIKTPYKIEVVPWDRVSHARYDARLAPLKIAMGIATLLLLAGILYYLIHYWNDLEPRTTIQIGLLSLAVGYGLRWAFMSRRHRFTFHLRDGSRLRWTSRSGDFKYKTGAVHRGVERLTELQLLRASP
ncbi:hypothetical protein CDN99_24010 [Roseateles aquatilis]|uniref:Uncharacterized protein n=1 Tax=Roseateles aquatilis TaxID=431061 RepID=A0A246IVZ7_9BURK|nr:hypothetical protein [Roseateles aquatilis]OWQ84364.1 hypothetical protein CDN99_24010 [Roseateles aquatilis]